MGRLTWKAWKDEQGNWGLRDLPWENLCAGVVMDDRTRQHLYGALCKLRDYEDTEMEPKEVAKHRWIPVEERLPEGKSYILLSFVNFSLPLVGRYEQDEDGGAFYIGDEDITCVSQGVFVNAWLPLPEPYRPDEEERIHG